MQAKRLRGVKGCVVHNGASFELGDADWYTLLDRPPGSVVTPALVGNTWGLWMHGWSSVNGIVASSQQAKALRWRSDNDIHYVRIGNWKVMRWYKYCSFDPPNNSLFVFKLPSITTRITSTFHACFTMFTHWYLLSRTWGEKSKINHKTNHYHAAIIKAKKAYSSTLISSNLSNNRLLWRNTAPLHTSVLPSYNFLSLFSQPFAEDMIHELHTCLL